MVELRQFATRACPLAQDRGRGGVFFSPQSVLVVAQTARATESELAGPPGTGSSPPAVLTLQGMLKAQASAAAAVGVFIIYDNKA